MPRPDVTNHEGILRRMYQAPVASGIFGWPIPWYSMQYLVGVGYVRIVYDWHDRKTKAELTENGRVHVEREASGARIILSPV